MSKAVVYFDVDDTLVRSVGTKRLPIPAALERVRALHTSGVTLYLWSTGGAAYARASAEELGIADCFVGPRRPGQSPPLVAGSNSSS